MEKLALKFQCFVLTTTRAVSILLVSLVSILLVKLQIGPVGILLVVTQINLTFFLFRELSKPYQLRSVSV